jgi:hypothetical protein
MITGLMVLQRIWSNQLPYWQQEERIVSWHLVLADILIEILFQAFYHSKIIPHLGDVVILTMPEEEQEISLRQTTLKIVEQFIIFHTEKLKYLIFLKGIPLINLDMGVGYSSNLEHVIGD